MAGGKSRLLETYRSCLKNAGALLSDAEILLDRGSYTRAYALAFTGIEEVAKSQLVADLFTGYIDRDTFDRAFRSHHRKIKRSQWAVYWSHGVLHELPKDTIRPQLSKRMAALYVDIADDLGPIEPAENVSEQEAQELIDIGHAGLDKIRQWELMGEMIGTKGFMK